MKVAMNHLSEVVLAVAASALIIGVVLSLSGSFEGFFKDVTEKIESTNKGHWGLGSPAGPGVGGGDEEETETATLMPPTLTITDGVLTIGTVENATSYDIYVNGELVQNTAETALDLATLHLGKGSYKITVTAKAEGYKDSVHGNSVTYAVLESIQPGLYKTGTGYSEVLMTWSELVDEGILNSAGSAIAGKEGKLDGDLVISGDLTEIREAAFKDCTKLTSVIIPENVKEIAASAFAGCEALQSLIFPKELDSLGAYAFQNCMSLEAISLPAGIEAIGDSTFLGCTSLASVTVPEGVTSVGESAFAFCSSLAQVDLPGGLAKIGDKAFQYCTGLVGIQVPVGIKSIGSYAFFGCPGLEGVDFEEGSRPDAIGTYAFAGCVNLSEIDVPDSVSVIGAYAFAECGGMKKALLPSSLDAVNEFLFLNCTSLENIAIPNGASSIGESAFYGCSSLQGVSVPATVKNVGSGAFKACSALSSVHYGGTVAEWEANVALGSEWAPANGICTVSCTDGNVDPMLSDEEATEQEPAPEVSEISGETEAGEQLE